MCDRYGMFSKICCADKCGSSFSGLEREHLYKWKFMSPLSREIYALLLSRKRESRVLSVSAVFQLPSAQLILMPKWHILMWHILIPFNNKLYLFKVYILISFDTCVSVKLASHSR